MTKTSVIIVGAGLAGLCCARKLDQAGVSYQLLEAADAVGGRVRTDRVDGFLLDRGFQVLLTAYPECRRVLDYGSLGLQPFEPGALIRYRGGFHRLTDPWRRPLAGLAAAWSPVGTFFDKLKIGRLRWDLQRRDLAAIFSDREGSTLEALRERGFSDAMVDTFFRPFLGGVFLESELGTSRRMFEFVFKMFSEGDTVLPAGGMQAIPESIAACLKPGSLRLEARVASVERGSCVLETGESLKAHSIVIATDGSEAARLLPGRAAPDWRATTCLYFDAAEPPIADRMLVLDGDQAGPVNNLCVISAIAPSYAPPDRSLVSVSLIGGTDRDVEQIEHEVRKQLADWFGSQVAQWRLLRVYRVARGLPDIAPSRQDRSPQTVEEDPTLLVCGDHVERGSIEGAMVSGRRTAEAILADANGPGRQIRSE